MASAEEEATKAVHVFYQALDDLLQEKGLEPMSDIWHHVEHATTAHPFGGWARGWTEVWATWQEGAAVFACYKGHKTRNERIGGIHELKVSVLGDLAVATGIYKSTLYMTEGPLELKVNCSNVVERRDGVWKIIQHHADQAPPDWLAKVGAMVGRGHS